MAEVAVIAADGTVVIDRAGQVGAASDPFQRLLGGLDELIQRARQRGMATGLLAQDEGVMIAAAATLIHPRSSMTAPVVIFVRPLSAPMLRRLGEDRGTDGLSFRAEARTSIWRPLGSQASLSLVAINGLPRAAYIRAGVVARSLLPVLAFLASILAAPAVSAQGFEPTRRWLGPVDDLGVVLMERPLLPLAALSLDPERAWLERLGFALFRSPDLFGEMARRAGLSCEVCHIGGGANRRFFVEGASIKPGTFDVTSSVFEGGIDDGRFNPLTIPGLGGAAQTAPFGHRGEFKDLAAVTRHVIVEEFGGVEPDRQAVAALVAHMERLKPPDNRLLDDLGRLSNQASAAARAGEALFHRVFPGSSTLSCAACHTPTSHFGDGRRHDVGTGGLIDTPSLRRGNLLPPFMHDGRFDRLDQVVAYFDSHFGLDLDPGDRANLIAYLEAVDGGGAVEPVALIGDLDVVDELATAAAGAIERRALSVLSPVIGVVRRELGQIHERFFGEAQGLAEARQTLIHLSAGFREAERHGEAGNWLLAGEWFRRTRDELGAARSVLEAVAPRSLYDPELLKRALAARLR